LRDFFDRRSPFCAPEIADVRQVRKKRLALIRADSLALTRYHADRTVEANFAVKRRNQEDRFDLLAYVWWSPMQLGFGASLPREIRAGSGRPNRDGARNRPGTIVTAPIWLAHVAGHWHIYADACLRLL
jgi:hypothetical protein